MWEKICAEGWESNGKTEKVAEIIDTQGFAFSVYFPFFVPFFRFDGGGNGKLSTEWSLRHEGKLVGVRVCGHTFHTPFPYPVGCLTLQDGM